uniref:Uncharacterized protein n=1 Tax=viral metagenome TaxID=1070528 RepID=A0A6M3J4W8_9ZZZZ
MITETSYGIQKLDDRIEAIYCLLGAVIKQAMQQKDEAFLLSNRLETFIRYWHMPISASYVRRRYLKYKEDPKKNKLPSYSLASDRGEINI